MLEQDQAIEEIRRIRHKISERYHHDTKQLVRHYSELQEKYSGRILTHPQFAVAAEQDRALEGERQPGQPLRRDKA